MNYNVLGELKSRNVDFEYTGSEEWVSIRCPFHEDEHPSCRVHVKKGNFTCFTCEASGPFEKLLTRIGGGTLKDIRAGLASAYGLAQSDQPIDPSVYEGYHANIFKALPLVKELKVRGITEDLIRQYRLGESRGKITIPIFSKGEHCVNIMRYSPGDQKKKFSSLPGRGRPLRLYPIEQLEYKRILLCGGMLKAVAAAAELNKHGIGAISCTGGEQAKNWSAEHLNEIAKDSEWLGVCMDVDQTGVYAARDLALRLHRLVKEVCVIELPLDKDKYPKGDVSDWIGAEGQKVKPLLDSALPFVIERSEGGEATGPAKRVNIQQVSRAENANKRLQFKALVSASEQSPYYLPKEVHAECNRSQDFCHVCPLFVLPTDVDKNTCKVAIGPENEQLLAMMNAKEAGMADLLKRALRIPPCKSVKFKTQSHYLAQSVLLTQNIDDYSMEDSATVSAVSIDCDVRINETYDLTGRAVPHPDTQRATGVISKYEAVKDTLAEYKLQPEPLRVFQPNDWTVEGLDKKFEGIYTELENHVTKIYRRQDLHFLYDLAWHSVLHFRVDNRVIKGWVEALAIGDSSQGKSDTGYYLMQHYGLGQRVDCKGASVAGLLGGLQQINGQWYVSWGVIPTNDRRLVLLEELKGMAPEVLSKLTDMRSSGVAEIPKIERGKTNARTRLIAVSNPRSTNDIDSYAFGVDVIKELIPNQEDIRRFDVIMVLSKSDIPIDVMQLISGKTVNGDARKDYTSELCRNLILWGWSREVDQIKFENWGYLLERTKGLCDVFTDAIPIVDRGSARFKLARLSASSAVRTFSHVPSDVETVLVRNCHVDHMVKYLTRLYTSSPFGYDRFTATITERDTLQEQGQLLKKLKEDVPHPHDFVHCLLLENKFDSTDIQNFSGYTERSDIAAMVSQLVRSRAIIREGKRYQKTTRFTELLSKLLAENELLKEAPNYIGDSLQ